MKPQDNNLALTYFFLQMVLGLFGFFLGIFFFFWLLGFFHTDPITVGVKTTPDNTTSPAPSSINSSMVDFPTSSSHRFQGMSGIIRG